MKRNFLCYFATLCAVCVVLVGCGSNDDLSRASLTGKVTYKGKPLTYGMVALMPTDGTKGPQGAGMINSNGTYEIRTAGQTGAVVGTHKVMVQCCTKVSDEELREGLSGTLITPSKYAGPNETPLKVQVPEGGLVFNIDLKD